MKGGEILLNSLPVKFFEEENDFQDDRFQKVKILIAHTGNNLNNVIFSKKVLEEMAKTLTYVPIVGYIEEDKNFTDFVGHEEEIIVHQDGFEIKYLGSAYGFIPENSEIKFELHEGKEWLTATGYLWSKFTNVIDIFNESNGTKSQSMEIENMEGFVNDKGSFVVDSARFSALCILGENVPPAMVGSYIGFFNHSKLKDSISEMVAEFYSERGEDVLDKDEKQVFDKETEEKVDKPIEEIEDVEEEKQEFADEEESGVEKEPEEELGEESEEDDVLKQIAEFLEVTIEEIEVIEENEDGMIISCQGVEFLVLLEDEKIISVEEVILEYSTKKQIAQRKEKEEQFEKLLTFYKEAMHEEKLTVLKEFGEELSEDVLGKYEKKLDTLDKESLIKELAYEVYVQKNKKEVIKKESVEEEDFGVKAFSLIDDVEEERYSKKFEEQIFN